MNMKFLEYQTQRKAGYEFLRRYLDMLHGASDAYLDEQDWYLDEILKVKDEVLQAIDTLPREKQRDIARRRFIQDEYITSRELKWIVNNVTVPEEYKDRIREELRESMETWDRVKAARQAVWARAAAM